MHKDIPKIIRLLRKEVGKTKAIVQHRTPFKVLVSTVLSARTRDEKTSKASAQLFKKYSSPKALSKAPLKEIEKLIRPAGFYREKAKRILQLSKELLERFNGKVPKNPEDLISLPGVGRKTANCVLVYAFSLPAVPVDVHVHRISNRIGLVRTGKPEETETELVKIVPKKYWIELNELMVKFGQRKCKPISPKCELCSLPPHCDYFKNVFRKNPSKTSAQSLPAR